MFSVKGLFHIKYVRAKANPTRMRTYKKSAANPFRIPTCTSLSNQIIYKRCRIRTYRRQIV
jgi:hypothetical protein